MIFQQWIWQRPFFSHPLAVFTRWMERWGILFGDLEDVLKVPDMSWFDPMYELKKRHLRTDILTHEGVSE